MSKRWSRGFEVARAASFHSNGITNGQKMGAALYAGSTLLSLGFNDYDRTSKHSQHSTYVGNLHAEIACLTRRWHYDKSNNLILYIARTVTDTKKTVLQYGVSRPCQSCMKAIQAFGVRRVRFFDENGIPTEVKI